VILDLESCSWVDVLWSCYGCILLSNLDFCLRFCVSSTEGLFDIEVGRF